MSILDKWKDYIPASSKGKEEKEEIPQEELRENLELTAKPEGTTSFNRKNVMIGLGVVALIYTPRTTPMPRVAAPNAGTGTQRGGLTPEQKIAAEKQKEKMAANQSPIGFKLNEEDKK